MSGVLEKVIEDWLTSATEPGYQASFAAWLTRRGERIIYYSRHSTLEHGKDIVSVGTDGKYRAYQLKAGDINSTKWRNMAGEVREASELPLSYPGIPTERVSTVTLVTSGQISDPAREKIRLTNVELSRSDCAEIETIEFPQLTAAFAAEFEIFLPNTIHDINRLLQLYVQDPTSPVDSSALLELLETVASRHLGDADSGSDIESRDREVQRTVSSLLILGEFLASPYRKAENAVSTIQVWTAVAVTCLYLQTQTEGSRANTQTALDICQEAIRESAEILISRCSDFELAIRDASLAGILLAGFKKAYVLGYLAAVANLLTIDGDIDREAVDLLAKAVDGPTGTTLWGEGSWNFVLNISCALYRHDDTRFLARRIVEDWIEYVLRDGNSSPPDCYHTIEGEFQRITGHKAESRVHRSAESSYTLRSAVDFLARDGARLVISTNWKKISNKTLLEFDSDCKSELLKYRAEVGVHRSTKFPITGRWTELQSMAMRTREHIFPEHTWLVPFYLLLLPHRVSPGLSGELHWLTADESDRRRWASGKTTGRKTVF